MNSVIKKLLALPQNLSLLVLNQSNPKHQEAQYLVIVVPISEQLGFLELYTKDKERIIEALAPKHHGENDLWYPLAVGNSPTAAMNVVDRLITDSLFEMSLKRFTRHVKAEMNKVVGSKGSYKVLSYPQLLGMS